MIISYNPSTFNFADVIYYNIFSVHPISQHTSQYNKRSSFYFYFLPDGSSVVYIPFSDSNMTSFFFRFVNKRASYRLGIISLAHAPVHMTDFPVVNVHVDELSSVRICQYKLCSTLSANVNINYRLPVKVHYRICTPRHQNLGIKY